MCGGSDLWWMVAIHILMDTKWQLWKTRSELLIIWHSLNMFLSFANGICVDSDSFSFRYKIYFLSLSCSPFQHQTQNTKAKQVAEGIREKSDFSLSANNLYIFAFAQNFSLTNYLNEIEINIKYPVFWVKIYISFNVDKMFSRNISFSH